MSAHSPLKISEELDPARTLGAAEVSPAVTAAKLLRSSLGRLGEIEKLQDLHAESREWIQRVYAVAAEADSSLARAKAFEVTEHHSLHRRETESAARSFHKKAKAEKKARTSSLKRVGQRIMHFNFPPSATGQQALHRARLVHSMDPKYAKVLVEMGIVADKQKSDKAAQVRAAPEKSASKTKTASKPKVVAKSKFKRSSSPEGEAKPNESKPKASSTAPPNDCQASDNSSTEGSPVPAIIDDKVATGTKAPDNQASTKAVRDSKAERDRTSKIGPRSVSDADAKLDGGNEEHQPCTPSSSKETNELGQVEDSDDASSAGDTSSDSSRVDDASSDADSDARSDASGDTSIIIKTRATRFSSAKDKAPPAKEPEWQVVTGKKRRGMGRISRTSLGASGGGGSSVRGEVGSK